MLDRDGRTQPLGIERSNYLLPRISPDGRRIALEDFLGGPNSFWVWDIDNGPRTALNTGGEVGLLPVWVEDRARILYVSLASDILSISADNAGPPQTIAASVAKGVFLAPHLAFSSRARLVFRIYRPAAGSDIFRLEPGSETPVRLLGGHSTR